MMAGFFGFIARLFAIFGEVLFKLHFGDAANAIIRASHPRRMRDRRKQQRKNNKQAY